MRKHKNDTVQVIIHIKKPTTAKREIRIIKASDAKFQAEITRIYKQSEQIKQVNKKLIDYQHKCLLGENE